MTKRVFELAYKRNFRMVMTAHRLNDTVLKAFDCKIIKIDEKISGVRLFRGSQKNVERSYNF